MNHYLLLGCTVDHRKRCGVQCQCHKTKISSDVWRDDFRWLIMVSVSWTWTQGSCSDSVLFEWNVGKMEFNQDNYYSVWTSLLLNRRRSKKNTNALAQYMFMVWHIQLISQDVFEWYHRVLLTILSLPLFWSYLLSANRKQSKSQSQVVISWILAFDLGWRCSGQWWSTRGDCP